MYYSPKTSTDGLVFHYDTGNTVRSYLGEPTVNLHPNPEDVSSWTGNLFNNWINSAVTSNVSTAPNRTLTADRLGDGYGRFNTSVSITGGQTYTYSVYLKNVSLTNNFAIVYAWGLNGTLVSYGTLVDVVVSQLSTTQWTRITATITAPGSGVNQVQFGPCPFTGYGNPSGQQIDVWGGMIEQKSHVTPYTAETRSATQGLKDLTGNRLIDLSNVSFNSNAQITFDGTDDGVAVDTALNLSSYSGLTVEGVVKGVGVGEYDRWFSGTSGTTVHYPDLAITQLGELRYFFASINDGWVPTGVTVSTTSFNYLTYTFTTAGAVKIYVNGQLAYSTTHSAGTFPSVFRTMIGNRYDRNGEALIGEVPLTKIYNRALTADEVQRNFNAVKSRFNIA